MRRSKASVVLRKSYPNRLDSPGRFALLLSVKVQRFLEVFDALLMDPLTLSDDA